MGIWSALPFLRLIVNSIVFAGGVTVAARVLRFPGRLRPRPITLSRAGRSLSYLVLATLMVPFQVTLVPVFELLFKLHWLNTYQGLIVPRATSAFGIFLLRQFFITVPRELDEAARADGASEWYIYSRIMLPLSKPALATLAVFYFMSNWNDFLWPLVVTSTTNMRTLPGRAHAVCRSVCD